MLKYQLKPRKSHFGLRILDTIFPSLRSYWLTIGNTIYYPDSVENPTDEHALIRHELVHVQQYEKYGTLLFIFLYLFVPLPIGFAYFRWYFEREAYLVNIKAGDLTIPQVVRMLDGYWKPWPKKWMTTWFRN